MRSLLVALSAVAVLACVQAPALAPVADDPWCEENTWSDDRYVRACEVVELTVRAGALDVEGHANGPVTVRYADRSDVLVRAKIEGAARDRDRAEALVRQSSVDAAGGTVRTRTPDVDDGWATVSLEVLAPRRTDVTATATNGPLAIEGLDGRIRGRVTNGPLTARALAGDVDVRAVNGPVRVTLAGDRWRGAGLTAEAQNGPVTVAVPRGYSARVDAATETARIDADDLALSGAVRDRGTYVGDALTGVLGDGGAPLRIRSQNGPVRLHAAD